MTLQITLVHGDFVARVSGVDLVRDLDQPMFERLRRALDEHGVLVVPGQRMTDEEQVEFSRRWGPLQTTKGVNPVKIGSNEPLKAAVPAVDNGE